MGIQTFQPNLLQRLGRRQETLDAVPQAVALLRKYGIQNLGFDLIYAIPGQNMNLWEKDLQMALSLEPRHISAYSLTLEEGTKLAEQRDIQLVDDELSFNMWEFAGTFLKEKQMPRYEISNYAAEKWEAEHNQNVWHGQSYLGLGPSASSFNGITRWTERASLTQWLQNCDPETDDIPRSQRIAEIFLMGLRTVKGWSWQEFYRMVPGAESCSDLLERLEELKTLGLLEDDGSRVRLTEQGLAFWNEAAEILL